MIERPSLNNSCNNWRSQIFEMGESILEGDYDVVDMDIVEIALTQARLGGSLKAFSECLSNTQTLPAIAKRFRTNSGTE